MRCIVKRAGPVAVRPSVVKRCAEGDEVNVSPRAHAEELINKGYLEEVTQKPGKAAKKSAKKAAKTED